MVIYIAGKMNGLPDKGRKAFEEAETTLKSMGFTVLNPACLPDGLPADRYLPTCLTMVDTADILVLLPNWIYSPGAMLEKAFAEYQGKMVFELGGLEKCVGEWLKHVSAVYERNIASASLKSLPEFIRNHCTFVENPVPDIGYVENLKTQVKEYAKKLDAAVEDLEYIANRGWDVCSRCKHDPGHKGKCKRLDETKDCFKWRGVKMDLKEE